MCKPRSFKFGEPSVSFFWLQNVVPQYSRMPEMSPPLIISPECKQGKREWKSSRVCCLSSGLLLRLLTLDQHFSTHHSFWLLRFPECHSHCRRCQNRLLSCSGALIQRGCFVFRTGALLLVVLTAPCLFCPLSKNHNNPEQIQANFCQFQ